MRTSSWNEYRLTWSLVHTMTLDAIVFKQFLAQLSIEIERLRMDRVVLVLSLELLSEELAKFDRVFCLE